MATGARGRSCLPTFALGLAAWIGSLGVLAQADPLLGTWVLNVTKSTYATGSPPKSQTVTFETRGPATAMISVTVAANGTTSRREYTAKDDGKDYPFAGSQAADAVSLKRIDARTVERTDKKGGKVVSILVRKLSADGNTLTVTSKNPSGQETGNVAVYERKRT
jgi:hypothetical protein